MKNSYKIQRIARNIIAKESLNILDDYYIFYSDGQWIISVIRKLHATIIKMQEKVQNYLNCIPKIDEYYSYVSDSDLDDLFVKDVKKQIKQFISDIKKEYKKIEKEKSDYEKYNQKLEKFKEFIESYEKACVSIFKKRYMEDEQNVRNLLQTIREKGNKVINE